MDSPSKNHVSIGKIIRPADEPINLAVQTDPVSSTMIFQAYQKQTEHGTPIVTAATKGLFCHHVDNNCALV